MKILNIAGCLAAATMMLTACGDNSGWKLDGTLANAEDGKTIYVEGSVLNNWNVLDSIKPDSDGAFSYTADEAAAQPSVYRLRYNGRYIYFPVDSTETVTVTADAGHFDTGYTIAGNIYARSFVTVDSLLASSIAAKGPAATLADANLKHALSKIINQDTTCLLSYYIIGKFVDGKPLYDLTNREDVRILANAANNFARLRPNDQRAKELEQRWINARRLMGNTPVKQVQMDAQISTRPQADLTRYDSRGVKHDFDKLVQNGKVTVLNFTRYDGEASQANTVALTEVYNRYKDRGVQIYQIAYDPDELSWKRSAANMPWIAVWNAPTDNIEALVAYNVDPINGTPVSFVFNRQGELVKRVSDPTTLESIIAPLL